MLDANKTKQWIDRTLSSLRKRKSRALQQCTSSARREAINAKFKREYARVRAYGEIFGRHIRSDGWADPEGLPGIMEQVMDNLTSPEYARLEALGPSELLGNDGIWHTDFEDLFDSEADDESNVADLAALAEQANAWGAQMQRAIAARAGGDAPEEDSDGESLGQSSTAEETLEDEDEDEDDKSEDSDEEGESDSN